MEKLIHLIINRDIYKNDYEKFALNVLRIFCQTYTESYSFSLQSIIFWPYFTVFKERDKHKLTHVSGVRYHVINV